MTESERVLLILTAMHTRDALDGAGYTASAKTLAEAIKSAQPTAQPKADASSLPRRLRVNSYNALTWIDCDVMREAAHALENKDAEIAAVIRDNDAKLAEIERLRKANGNLAVNCSNYRDEADSWRQRAQELEAHNDAPRNPDIEAAALRPLPSPPATREPG